MIHEPHGGGLGSENDWYLMPLGKHNSVSWQNFGTDVFVDYFV